MSKSAAAILTASGGAATEKILVQNNTTNSYQIQNVQNYIKELEISEGQLSSCIK